MSTPTDSVAPAPPTGSSNPWPLVQWWKRVCDWIAAMSPSGADRYDTGWVDVTPSNATGSAVAYRRIGRVCYLRGEIHTLTPGATLWTLPPGFRPPLRLAAHLVRGGAGTAPSNATARIFIQSTGEVLINNQDFAIGAPGFGLGHLSWPVD